MVDLFSAVAFSTRTLLLALETGDPFRITRSILLEAIGRPFNEAGRRGARELIERAGPLIEGSGSAYLQGLQHMAWAAICYTSGRWPESLAEAEQAEKIFDGERRTAWWELAASRNTVLWCHQMLGHSALLAERSDAWFEDARGRGDRFSLSTIGVFAEPLRRMGEDRPEEALAILEESLALCPPPLLNQRSLAAIGRGYIQMYLGNGLQAYEAIESHWPELRRSYMLRNDIMRITALEIRMRGALLAMIQTPTPERFVASAERDMRLLEKESLAYVPPILAKGRACLAAFRGDRETAVRELERSAGLCERLSLQPPANSVRRVLGVFLGNERGAALVREADAFLLASGFRNPARYARMHVPLLTSEVAVEQRREGS